MRKITKLKIATILSFLIIIFPGDHVALPNGIILFFSLFQSLWSIFYEDFNLEMYIYTTSVILGCCSLLFIIFKKELINILGIIIQFIWLGYMFKIDFLRYWYYFLPTSIYFVLIIILLYFIFFKKNQDQ